MDVTSAPGPHNTEARAGPRLSDFEAEVVALLLLVFLLADGQSRASPANARRSE
jgi:hypothetical protein